MALLCWVHRLGMKQKVWEQHLDVHGYAHRYAEFDTKDFQLIDLIFFFSSFHTWLYIRSIQSRYALGTRFGLLYFAIGKKNKTNKNTTNTSTLNVLTVLLLFGPLALVSRQLQLQCGNNWYPFKRMKELKKWFQLSKEIT